MKKEQLKEYLRSYNFTYDMKEDYTNLYNACIDYMNDKQNWNIEQCFESIIDYKTAEEYAKSELENGGLVRLYYFLGNANCNNDIFKINGDGNLENATIDDLKDIVDEVLEVLDNED